MVRPPSPAEVLGILVKAPSPGAVKTRLAREIGAEHATALYERLGRAVVRRSVWPRRHATAIWFSPAGAEAAVRSWLESPGVHGFRPQRSGGLGARLAAVFRWHFAEGAERVVVIGSDCPDVGRFLVRRAFRLLEQRELVIGPARDGGFYLLGLRHSAPGLFRRVVWSTDAVFARTMANAARLGLGAAVLPELRDVDTVEDALILGLLESHPSGHVRPDGHSRSG